MGGVPVTLNVRKIYRSSWLRAVERAGARGVQFLAGVPVHLTESTSRVPER